MVRCLVDGPFNVLMPCAAPTIQIVPRRMPSQEVLKKNCFLPFLRRIVSCCCHAALHQSFPSGTASLPVMAAASCIALCLKASMELNSSEAGHCAQPHHHGAVAGGCICFFTFKELCGQPLSAADYIALAESYHSVAISGVPIVTSANRPEAYRFMILIDVLYDHRSVALSINRTALGRIFGQLSALQACRGVSICS